MSLLAVASLIIAVAAPGPRLALALGVKEGGGEPELFDAVRQQIRLGLDGTTPSLKWDDYEAQSGKPLTDAVGLAKFTNQEMLLTISTIDTAKRRLPQDVMYRKWNDPELLARFDTFLTSVVKQLGPQTKWISLGNEVNVYLTKYPGETEPYIAFLAHGRETIKKANPKLQVGVTVTFSDTAVNPVLTKKLQSGMDVSVFTYYPLAGFKVMDPSQVASHFDLLAQWAGEKPLLLQEIGYPASTLCGSSDAQQAKFVGELFTQIDRFSNKIALASYFMQTDFPSALVKAFEGYYESSDPQFLGFLGTLGLHDKTGKPRAAWGAFKQEVLKRKPLL